MISTAVYARYARALADVAVETGADETVRRELGMYREIFAAVPDLPEALHSPAVPRESKERILAGLMARYPVSRTTGNFLRILVANYRVRYFGEIVDSYVRTVEERRGVVSARVRAAAPLAESQLASLRAALAKATGRSVRLDVQEDPELLGGVIVQVGSTLYDGSLRRQLEELRTRLSGR